MWWGAYATLGLSLVSAFCGAVSLGLNARRERRDAAARRPRADFALRLQARDRAVIECRLANRGETDLRLDLIAVERGPWHFETEAGALFETLHVGAVIEPGQSFRRSYTLRADASLDASAPVSVALTFHCRQQGQPGVLRPQVTRHST